MEHDIGYLAGVEENMPRVLEDSGAAGSSLTTQHPEDRFETRHLGPSASDTASMLDLWSCHSLDEFTERVVPSKIRLSPESSHRLRFPSFSESESLAQLRRIATKNKLSRSYIGMGYYGCITPAVIQRNILENPGWYTQYTPYQAEISQGRLEALLNFQTMVRDLTGLGIANASLLDEGTAAAEAMNMSRAHAGHEASVYFVSDLCHPQTIAVLQTRAKALGVKAIVGRHEEFEFTPDIFGALVQYPATDGRIDDYSDFIARAHRVQALVTVATDLLALTLLKPPGELGADIAVGSAQRFGVPLGYGGPHAAFFATRDELKRHMPGRLIGISKDAAGRSALRLALQTREQHIRREKATSNICTAQVLLAVMASMYAVYHGPEGLKRIAKRVHGLTALLARVLENYGLIVQNKAFFDTLRIGVKQNLLDDIRQRSQRKLLNLRYFDDQSIGIALDETTRLTDLADIVEVVSGQRPNFEDPKLNPVVEQKLPAELVRTSAYLSAPVFNRCRSETEFLRYVRTLEARDLSLAFSMIPLGSCTMKLNATSEMLPVSWAEFSSLHPFAPIEQTRGYQELFKQLETNLRAITGMAAVSLQPNSGAQGEYTGLLVIRAYLESRGEGERKVCLIPHSAHGTNPASASMAGFEVVVVECDGQGNIDVKDLKAKIKEHAQRLGAFMVTYPSTHGVFENAIRHICDLVHSAGGQVYMDGANLNALVGICRPYDIGADVCHINLHKTFAIPHGGGGPGMGPIAVRKHLAPYLPNHPLVDLAHAQGIGPVAAAPWGSASILTIPWVYMQCMGGEGLRKASQVAILNANYIAKRLDAHYPVLYRGQDGFVAHECILDLRPLEKTSGIKVEDVAKRLMDYGFHAPTVSFPVSGTMMVEPTESESKAELDRFCDAMIAIRCEIREIEEGRMDREDNPLKNAPHTAFEICNPEWRHPYSREQAVFPAAWTKEHKFWPAVGRIDNVYGDRNLVCGC